ncbi:hypothetical protein [Actinopolymorpha alba]|uniref:hypothetical protein n=1 Tax=Actinopolymorpha alba TaxID=533267 RepID=UPI0012F6EF4B|nr:hypothetical protein [Actinopolymorpha alba]
MTAADWRTVLRYFRDRPDMWTPCIDLETAEHFDPAIVDWGDQILARGDLPGQLNARFWNDELEVDLDPRLVTEDEHVLALHGFMRELGQLLERDVAMSWEGAREAVEFRYRSPQTRSNAPRRADTSGLRRGVDMPRRRPVSHERRRSDAIRTRPAVVSVVV